MSETLVTVDNPDTEPVTDVAFAAGKASADVDHLTDEVEEVTMVAETAQAVATEAHMAAAESVSAAAVMLDQMRALLDDNEEIKTAIVLMATRMDEMFDFVRENLTKPEPETSKKPDTAPKRKSNTHKFLYGG